MVRPFKKSYFGIHDIEGMITNPVTSPFSDLREHKFRHKFQCFSPMCLCQTGIQNNEHFFLHCPLHSNHRKDLLDRISNVVDVDIGNLSSTDICNLLLCGNSRLSFDTNRHINNNFYKINRTFQADSGKLAGKPRSPQTTLSTFHSFPLALSAYSTYVNN